MFFHIFIPQHYVLWSNILKHLELADITGVMGVLNDTMLQLAVSRSV